MTRAFFLILVLLAAPAWACTSVDGLPDRSPDCTPGSVDPAIDQSNIGSTICKPGYSKSVRPPVGVTNPMKRQVMREYGMDGEDPRLVEGDHFLPISSGGCPGPSHGCDFHANFWPQVWQSPRGAHDKDRLEDELHRRVCRNELPLAEAQKAITADWVAAYLKYVCDHETGGLCPGK